MSIKDYFYGQDQTFLEGYFRNYIQRNITNKGYTKRTQRIALNQLVENWSNEDEKELLRKVSLEFK